MFVDRDPQFKDSSVFGNWLRANGERLRWLAGGPDFLEPSVVMSTVKIKPSSTVPFAFNCREHVVQGLTYGLKQLLVRQMHSSVSNAEGVLTARLKIVAINENSRSTAELNISDGMVVLFDDLLPQPAPHLRYIPLFGVHKVGQGKNGVIICPIGVSASDED